MIDYSEAELNAISAVFLSSEVYLCEFHREQGGFEVVSILIHCIIVIYTV